MEKGITKKLRNLRPKVEVLLRTESKHRDDYRDNDEVLIARFWANELKALGLDKKTMSVQDFFVLYTEGKITPADLVLRARRKAQELNEDCRGKRWYERHGLAEDLKNNIDEI
jgi:hypothetical protein